MKFLVDAQLPARLAAFLTSAGHDTLHTNELPDGNRSTDGQIARRADADERGGHEGPGLPRGASADRLSTPAPRRRHREITNDALLSLVELNLDAIVSAFAEASFVQLTEEALMLGRPRDPSG